MSAAFESILSAAFADVTGWLMDLAPAIAVVIAMPLLAFGVGVVIDAIKRAKG